MKALPLLFSLLFTVVVSDEKCCEECIVEGEIKYYSIDTTGIDVENAA